MLIASDVFIPSRILIEVRADDSEARDVIIELENGVIYTAVFITLHYLKRQMELTHDLTQQLEDTIPVRFAALDTPHIVVDRLERDIIEDTIDNLLAMDIFDSYFTQVTDSPEETAQGNGNGQRATQELAAVVITDVLVVEG
ncbi:MAG: hypothetical protein SH821_04470 [Phototrophicales bacterium]|mgnify:CR=1 FL=1|nr:hypothetical protein [Phototrophicales bacterium]